MGTPRRRPVFASQQQKIQFGRFSSPDRKVFRPSAGHRASHCGETAARVRPAKTDFSLSLEKTADILLLFTVHWYQPLSLSRRKSFILFRILIIAQSSPNVKRPNGFFVNIM
jgi:hypothetical protein